jgi:hypothetical protein
MNDGVDMSRRVIYSPIPSLRFVVSTCTGLKIGSLRNINIFHKAYLTD